MGKWNVSVPRRAAVVAAAALIALLGAAPVAPLRAQSHTLAGVVVADVPTPTALHATDTHLYVTSFGSGRVVRLAFLPGGRLGPPEPVADGFSGPLGVAVAADGTIFVADSRDGGETYGGRTVGRVQAIDPATGEVEVVVDGLPNGRHNTNNVVIHDGRLYITNGNSTDDGVEGGDPELPLSGTLLSVPLSLRGHVVGPNGRATGFLTVEASGMRNLYDVAFRPGTNEAWIPTNGPDQLDPYGEDTLVKVPDVTRYAPDFGFPNCLYNADGELMEDPPAGPCRGHSHTPPEELLGMHVSADGLAFGPNDDFWSGDLFIAEFGSIFPSGGVAGHRVVRVPVDVDGDSSAPEDLVLGGTPLDLVFGTAGLYVADFGAGTITLYQPSGL